MIAAATAAVITWVFTSRQLEVAQGQMRIADGQKKIAAARLNLDLYEKRYAVYEAARSLLIATVQGDHVDAEQVIMFKIKTLEAVFLFNQDIMDYLQSLLDKVLRLKRLNAQEKAADEYGEEEKRHRLIDLGSEQHQQLAAEVPVIIEKFKPYLKLGDISD